MKHILYIGNQLQGSSHNPTYISKLAPLLSAEGYGLKTASSLEHPFLRLLDMLGATLKYSYKTDLVIIDTYSTLNFYYALCVSQLCRLLKLPYICILHGGQLPQRLRSSPVLSRVVFKNAYLNVAPSHYLMQEFRLRGFNNLTYIPNVMDLHAPEISDRSYQQAKLLWVRSFAALYNPMMAIKVLEQLQGQAYESQLCMVGPEVSGLQDHCAQYAKEHELKVRFTGKLSRREWSSLSKDFNIFLNTSNVDNTPMSVLEAMALGLPVISSNVGGMPFLIEDGVDGLLVAPDDAEAMAQAVRKLLTDSQLRGSIIANAQKKAEQFTWKHIKQSWFEILGR